MENFQVTMVMVEGVPSYFSALDLEQEIEKAPGVRDVTAEFDLDKDQERTGIAYVKFRSPSQAAIALEHTYITDFGRTLSMYPLKSKNKYRLPKRYFSNNKLSFTGFPCFIDSNHLCDFFQEQFNIFIEMAFIIRNYEEIDRLGVHESNHEMNRQELSEYLKTGKYELYQYSGFIAFTDNIDAEKCFDISQSREITWCGCKVKITSFQDEPLYQEYRPHEKKYNRPVRGMIINKPNDEFEEPMSESEQIPLNPDTNSRQQMRLQPPKNQQF